MKNFSKLFLASLLAGSLIMTGCGESNPTSANVSTDTDTSTATDTKVDTYEISGRVMPTDGYVAPNAKFLVTISNTDKPAFEGTEFTFSDLKAGTYTLTAKETVNGKYSNNSVSVTITNAAKDNIEIPVKYNGDIPKYTFKGEIVDNQKQGLKFAQVSVTNGAISKDANTNPDNGKFTLVNITPGKYDMTITADACKTRKITLVIDETGTKVTLNNENVSNFDFGQIPLQPNYTSSGALEGFLTDPATGKAVAKGSKIFIYMRNNDPTVKPSVLASFVTDDDTGYFSIDSLPTDYYAGSINEVTDWDISKDKDGNPLSYNIPTNQQCFNWIKVTDGSYSKIPGFSK